MEITHKNTYTITLTKEQVSDLVINQLRANGALPPIPFEKFHFQPKMKTIYDTAGDVHDCYREEVYDGLVISYETKE